MYFESSFRDVVLRLIEDAGREWTTGNPFKALVDHWWEEKDGMKHPGRGQMMVAAAMETYLGDGAFMSLPRVKDLRVAYDIWMDLRVMTLEGRHHEDVHSREEFVGLAKSVLTLTGIGVEEKRLKADMYREAHAYLEQGEPKARVYQRMLENFGYWADDLEAQHNQKLEEQLATELQDR